MTKRMTTIFETYGGPASPPLPAAGGHAVTASMLTARQPLPITEVFDTIMSSSVQYSAFTRLLTHNNRVHDMEEMLRKMWVPSDWETDDEDIGESWIPNPFAELQDDMDRESRACLVSCWAALPVQREEDDLFA